MVRPLQSIPTAVSYSEPGYGSRLLAQAQASDLDAALGVPGAAPAATKPAAAPASAPTPAKDSALLEQAMGQPQQSGGNYAYIGGKWVLVPAGAATQPGLVKGPDFSEPGTPAMPLTQQRVIRIPVEPLRAGVSKYNIVVRAGDIVNVVAPEVGEYYIMGQVNRPGVFSLTGRKITLKQAVAAAGNLGPLAIPRRCDLVRRIGPDQEAIVAVDLQKIFDGEKPDIYLKPNDLVNVGTDVVAPFLAVTRNAYRASYGWGFVYDRNFYITPTVVQNP
jgi:hypothetical protein